MISTVVYTTEDGARDAEDVMHALLSKALHAARMSRPHPTLVPIAAPAAQARLGSKATHWRARSGPEARLRIALVRELSNQLAEPHVAVAFHFDADCPRGTTPPASAAFAELRADVDRLLADNHKPPSAGRLLSMVPHWCIESWTMQHTRKAAAICRAKGNQAAASHFEELLDSTVLEDVRPYDHAHRRVVGKGHNLELAGDSQFPAGRLLAIADSSYAAAFTRLRDVLDPPPPPASEAG